MKLSISVTKKKIYIYIYKFDQWTNRNEFFIKYAWNFTYFNCSKCSKKKKKKNQKSQNVNYNFFCDSSQGGTINSPIRHPILSIHPEGFSNPINR